MLRSLLGSEMFIRESVHISWLYISGLCGEWGCKGIRICNEHLVTAGPRQCFSAFTISVNGDCIIIPLFLFFVFVFVFLFWSSMWQIPSWSLHMGISWEKTSQITKCVLTLEQESYWKGSICGCHCCACVCVYVCIW